jgi:hypothetical protein
MGPEGFEPTPAWLKARDAAVTPRPRLRTWRSLLRCSRCMTISFAQSLGTELNRRFRRIRTMCFRYTTKRSRDGQNRTAAFDYRGPTSSSLFARRRSLLSKTRGRPVPLTPNTCSSPCGIRTQPGQLERLATSPEVERAMCADDVCLRNIRIFGGGLEGARILLPWSSARRRCSFPLGHLSYQPMLLSFFCLRQKEKARCPLRDTGLL